MTTVAKFATPSAAAEVDARAQRYLTEHQGATYRETLGAVLRSDKALAQAYAEPAQHVKRVPTTPTPAVPVTGDDEREVLDWMLRALRDGKAGSLPGALGQLSIEAARFAKIGMDIEEAAKRAMGLFPSLVALSKLLLADVRRNAPENKPVADGETLAQRPGDIVHARAVKLQEKHGHLDYHEAIGCVLSDDPALKAR
jgi:hypothetical protein